MSPNYATYSRSQTAELSARMERGPSRELASQRMALQHWNGEPFSIKTALKLREMAQKGVARLLEDRANSF